MVRHRKLSRELDVDRKTETKQIDDFDSSDEEVKRLLRNFIVVVVFYFSRFYWNNLTQFYDISSCFE